MERETTMTAPKITVNSNAKAKATCQWTEWNPEWIRLDEQMSMQTTTTRGTKAKRVARRNLLYPLAT